MISGHEVVQPSHDERVFSECVTAAHWGLQRQRLIYQPIYGDLRTRCFSSLLCHQPKIGEVWSHGDSEFDIADADEQRKNSVMVRRASPDEAAPEEQT